MLTKILGRSADSAIYLCFRNIHQSLSRSKTSQPPFVDTEETISPKIPSLSRGIPYLSEVGPPSLEYRKESLFKSTLFTIKSFCPSICQPLCPAGKITTLIFPTWSDLREPIFDDEQRCCVTANRFLVSFPP